MDGWMDDLQGKVLFNSISVISDDEMLIMKGCVQSIELRLWLRRFCLDRGSNSIR